MLTLYQTWKNSVNDEEHRLLLQEKMLKLQQEINIMTNTTVLPNGSSFAQSKIDSTSLDSNLKVK